MVRDQQQRVDDKARSVVECFGGGEGAVPALVGQFPDAGEKEALDDGICYPCADTESVRRQTRNLRGNAEQNANEEEISEDVEEREEGVSLEAVRWDCVVDFLHGVGGRCEEGFRRLLMALAG